jgi:hypothetical protein
MIDASERNRVFIYGGGRGIFPWAGGEPSDPFLFCKTAEDQRYFDEETGHVIATMKVEIYSKTREVMVAYLIEEDCAKLITIHPLKEGQKENRVKTGRWRKL